jgi:hypothetical protein
MTILLTKGKESMMDWVENSIKVDIQI